MQAQAEAERTREALAERLAELQDESRKCRYDRRGTRSPAAGRQVVVPRLGYDRPGRLVKLDPRKKTAVVAIGHVTWNVAIDELIPQTDPRLVAHGSGHGRPPPAKNLGRAAESCRSRTSTQR